MGALPAAWDDDQHRLVVEEIPVDYDFVLKEVPDKWSRHSPDFILHVGVSHLAEKLSKVDPVGMDPSNVEPDVSVSTKMVATVGAAVPAAIVDPPWAAICSLSELISSLAALYLSVAAALRFVCSATALSAVDLADWPPC